MRPTLLAIALTALLTAGCTTSRVTTTERTAVEQALLSQSAEETLAHWDFRHAAGKRFAIEQEYFEGTDGKYLLAALQARLLEGGLRAAPEKGPADIAVYPRVAHAGVDESSVMIGIPEFPIAIPGVGTLAFPEMAFFKRHTQLGRNRMAVCGVYTHDGSQAFATSAVSSQKRYVRWTLLFFLSFRTTNLAKPF